MLRRLKLLAIALAAVLWLAPAPALAYNPLDQTCKTPGASSSSACNTSGKDTISGTNGVIYRVATVFALITSVAAVVIIIVGGISYATAAGDASKAANARKAIIGALIGLAIVGLAQLIVTFIINRIG